ncbi:MAG: ATP-binding protein, partial [Synergistaceae bacterium]|nr:ATP-binding protein [Synergistaceae bacterium]
MSEEKFYFQSEAAELLQMMISSVYSNKDIFLRELISNASDALDKRRIECLKDSELAENKNPEIKIEIDTDAKTLSVSDNGIGMSRDEIIQYLGTIAKSGTKDFLKAAKDSNTPQELIG